MWGLGPAASIFVLSGPLSAQNALETAVAEIMARYEQCIENAKERTLLVKKEALRPKFFAAKVSACDRLRDAEISIAQANAGIAETREQRAALEAEIAAMTAALLAGARTELGLPTSN